MDRNKIIEEMERIQEQMKEVDPKSDDYKCCLQRLSDLEDLERKLDDRDPEMIKALAEQDKVDAQRDALDTEIEENEKSKRHSVIMTVLKGIGVVGLMFVSHCLSVSTVPDKIDQKMTETFYKEKD